MQIHHLAVGDFGYTSTGNWHRANLVLDWAQRRYGELDRGLAQPLPVPTVLAAPYVNGGVDQVQAVASELRRSLERLGMHLLLRGIINPTEDVIGMVRNAGQDSPAEVVVDSE